MLFFPVELSSETPPNYTRLRESMVQEQIYQRGITDKRLLKAFRKVKRHLFVRKELRYKAYGDYSLDIGEGQQLSQPYIVAFMTYAIDPNPKHPHADTTQETKRPKKKVLEIGTGSGYHAAILAELFDSVYTIEVLETLGQDARNRLDLMGYKNIKVKIGDGYEGWKEHAPYDAIIVTCSEDHIPRPLIDQLAIGGRLIIPVMYSTNIQELVLLEKIGNRRSDWKKTQLFPVDFSPIIRSSNKQKQK